ncbi:O-methyltransferase [Nocardiopsis sp. CNT312]|uniref:O-methyltransferase n=1 Tax=Nocardiopsis sp. CNT312 TaxID=1137268 RepID=UPI00068889EC|nr:class I SAM-dependent methyltransferase [Nocardiopsis sp. CNT312]
MTWARTEQNRFAHEAVGEGPLADAYETALRSTAPPVDPAAGAALRFLAAAIGTRSAVEVGTGCGVSGVWLLKGMAADGILTSVDTNAAYQDHARSVYAAEGFGTGRARLIRGRALEVLPRLADGGYDLVFVDADPEGYPLYLREALRLLRPGGILAFNEALTVSPEPDGPLRAPDPVETAVRETVRQVREDASFVPLLLPVGGGLLAAIHRPAL